MKLNCTERQQPDDAGLQDLVQCRTNTCTHTNTTSSINVRYTACYMHSVKAHCPNAAGSKLELRCVTFYELGKEHVAPTRPYSKIWQVEQTNTDSDKTFTVKMCFLTKIKITLTFNQNSLWHILVIFLLLFKTHSRLRFLSCTVWWTVAMKQKTKNKMRNDWYISMPNLLTWSFNSWEVAI